MSSISTPLSKFGLDVRSKLSLKIKGPEPFVKWAGGKKLLKNTIISFFPKDYSHYYEPFIGGGSIFFSVDPKVATIADSNNWLIETYIAVRDNWKLVTNLLDHLINTKDNFLRVRATKLNELNLITRAAHFIFLNKTCFRGLFRVNGNGQFNVPFGAYNRKYYNQNNLKIVSKYLKGVNIRSCDFELALDGITKKDFVYFDPPYYKLGGYSDFNRYTAKKFSEMDQLRLATVCNELDIKGIRWALSNSDTEFIRKIYSHYRIERITARREINLNPSKRTVSELLILNY